MITKLILAGILACIGMSAQAQNSKVEEPKDGDLKGIAHALCGHQRFCPNQRCHVLLPSWENCTKRREKPVEAAGREITAKAGKSTSKKKRTQNA